MRVTAGLLHLGQRQHYTAPARRGPAPLCLKDDILWFGLLAVERWVPLHEDDEGLYIFTPRKQESLCVDERPENRTPFMFLSEREIHGSLDILAPMANSPAGNIYLSSHFLDFPL